MAAQPATFCRLELGDLEVTFVPDGHLCSTPEGSYPGSPDELWRANPQHLDAAGRVVMSLGTLLVRTAGKVALIDLGWGPRSMHFGGPGADGRLGGIYGGSMLDNLARVGVQPEEVDVVLFSHLHADHTGWVGGPRAAVGDGAVGEPSPVTFPNAEHLVSEDEWTYWTKVASLGVGPAPSAEQLATLGQRLGFVGDGDRPLPGIEVLATAGHTPGHLSFVLSSGAERAVVLGDALHCPIEILEPELTFIADVDPALARRTRARIEQELLAPDTLAAGPHFADLVFGRLLPAEGRPVWRFPASQTVPAAG